MNGVRPAFEKTLCRLSNAILTTEFVPGFDRDAFALLVKCTFGEKARGATEYSRAPFADQRQVLF